MLNNLLQSLLVRFCWLKCYGHYCPGSNQLHPLPAQCWPGPGAASDRVRDPISRCAHLAVSIGYTTIYEASGMHATFGGNCDGRYVLQSTMVTPLSRVLSQGQRRSATVLKELLGRGCAGKEVRDRCSSSNHDLVIHRQLSWSYFVCSLLAMTERHVMVELCHQLQALRLQPTSQWYTWNNETTASHKQQLNYRPMIKVLKGTQQRPHDLVCTHAERTLRLQSLSILQQIAQRKTAVLTFLKILKIVAINAAAKWGLQLLMSPCKSKISIKLPWERCAGGGESRSQPRLNIRAAIRRVSWSRTRSPVALCAYCNA